MVEDTCALPVVRGALGLRAGITRLPPGPLGQALARLTPVQRAIVLAEILDRPLALRRSFGDT